MSKESETVTTEVYRNTPPWFLVQLREAESRFALLFLRINRPDGSEIQQMINTGLGECLLSDGDKVQVTLGKDPIMDPGENDISVMGVWSDKKCRECIFNPVNPKYEELKCKAALKSEY